MKKEDEKIALDSIPKNHEYEYYVASIIQAGGYFTERNIKNEENGELFELDVVSSKFEKDTVTHGFSEIKSGGWGYKDIFKIAGWRTFLDRKKIRFENGNTLLIVQNADDKIEEKRYNASILDVSIIVNAINNGKLDNHELFDKFNVDTKDNITERYIIPAYRFAFTLEDIFFHLLNKERKAYPDKECLKLLAEYWTEVGSYSFYVSDPRSRINRLFADFTRYHNLTAKISQELAGNTAEEDASILNSDFAELFYNQEKINVLHISLYVELLNKLILLKTCVEEMFYNYDAAQNPFQKFLDDLRYAAMPQNITSGLELLRNHDYVYLYPVFWQIFIYLFGGFILLDKKEEEYKLLSKLSGIPVSKIDEAFSAFDLLFPLKNGQQWMRDLKYRSIRRLDFFPTPLCGIGANFRRHIYAGNGDISYDNLDNQLSGKYTITDLCKYETLTYKYFDKFVK